MIDRIKTIIKWLIALTAIIAAATIFIGFALYLTSLLPPVQKKALNRCQQYLNTVFDSSVTLQSVSTNLVTNISFNDVVIRDRFAPDDSIHIAKLRIGYILPFIMLHRIVVTELTMDKLTINLTRHESGVLPLVDNIMKKAVTFNTAKHSNRSNRSAPWEYSVNSLHINRIEGTFHDNHTLQHAVVNSATLSGKLHRNLLFDIGLNIHEATYRSPWWVGDVSTLSVDGTISPEGVLFSKVLVAADKSDLIGKGYVPFNRTGIWDISAVGRSLLTSVPILYNRVPQLERKGEFLFSASWIGSMREPQLSVAITGNKLNFNKIAFDSIKVQATSVAEDSLTSSFFIYSAAGRVAGVAAGRIENLMSDSLSLLEYATTLNYSAFTPESIPGLSTYVPALLSGIAVSGVCTINGTGTARFPEDVSVSAKVTGCTLFSDTLQLSAAVSGSTWSVTSRLLNNTLCAEGDIIDFKHITGTMAASIPTPYSISRVFLSGLTRGNVQLSGTIGGTLATPEFDVVINGTNGCWRGICIDTCGAELHLSPQTQTLDTLVAHVRADGQTVSRFIPNPVKGELTADIEASGHLFKPDVYSSIEGSNLRYKNISLDSARISLSCNRLDSFTIHTIWLHSSRFGALTEATAQGSISSRRVNLSATIKKDAAHLTDNDTAIITNLLFSGTCSNDSLSIKCKINDFKLDALSAIDTGLSLKGEAELAFTVNGAISNPTVVSSVMATDIRFHQFKIDHLSASVEMVDSSADLFSVVHPGAGKESITIKGLLPLRPSQKWTIDTSCTRKLAASVRSDKIPLQNFMNTADTGIHVEGALVLSIDADIENNSIPLHGMIDISHAQVKSSLHRVAASGIGINVVLDGTVKAPAATFSGEAGPVDIRERRIRKITTIGTLHKQELDIYSVKVLLPDSGLILLAGKIPIGKTDSLHPGADPQLNYSIVDFPVQMLTALLPGNVFQEGVIEGKGTVQFIESKPVVSGDISLKKGMVVSENLNPSIGPVDAEIHLSGDSIRVRSVNARWGSGAIEGNGLLLRHKGALPTVRLFLTANNCSWATPDILYGSVDHAELEITTLNNKIAVSGKVALGATRYIQDIQLTDIISRLKLDTLNARERPPRGFIDSIVLNVKVDLQENAAVDITMGSITLDGTCIVTGSVAKPSFIGEITVPDGYILYLDRRFHIEHAAISNFDANNLFPVIDLEATADILSMNGDQAENYTILLTLKGDMRNPVFTLKDETGTLNQLEIISILTLGQPLGGISGDIRERLTAFVSQSLFGFGTRKLEQFLGIEKIDLKGDVFNGKQIADNTRVTIVKRITPRLILLYEGDVAKMNRPKLSALYRIANNIFLSGETDKAGESGIDVIFKYSK